MERKKDNQQKSAQWWAGGYEKPRKSQPTKVNDFQGFKSQRTVMRNIFYTTNRKKKELNLRLEETLSNELFQKTKGTGAN